MSDFWAFLKIRAVVFNMYSGVIEYTDFFNMTFCNVYNTQTKMGVFLKISKYSVSFCFITQLVKNLQLVTVSILGDLLYSSVYLNTEWALRDIWLL